MPPVPCSCDQGSPQGLGPLHLGFTLTHRYSIEVTSVKFSPKTELGRAGPSHPLKGQWPLPFVWVPFGWGCPVQQDSAGFYFTEFRKFR